MKRTAQLLALLWLLGATDMALGQESLTRDQKELMKLLQEDLEKRPRTKFRKPQDIEPDRASKFQGAGPAVISEKYRSDIESEQKRDRIKHQKSNHKDDWYDEENYDTTSKLRSGSQEIRAKAAFQGIYSEDRRYGKVRFGIGVAKPAFSDENTKIVLDTLYGSTNLFPKVDIEYTPFDWLVGIGAHLSLGMYRQSGRAVNELSTLGNIIKDDSASETKVKFYPLQVGVSGRLGLFSHKFIVLDGKIAFEHLLAREVRDVGKVSGNDSFVTKANKNGVVFGLGASVSLNGLSQRAVASMRSSVRLGYMYVRGFYELSQQFDTKKGANFSRSTCGLSIVAETF